MKFGLLTGIFFLTAVWMPLLIGFPGAYAASPPQSQDQSVIVENVNEVWKGDLPDIIAEQRVIRVLTSYNNTGFFIEKGKPRGLEYELLHEYAKQLNQGLKQNIQVKLVFQVVPFDRLIPDLRAGRGDIAAAGLTVTPGRAKKVAFTIPYIKDVDEIVVASKKAPALEAIRNLAGRTVRVVAGSSYVDHLQRLNKEFASKRIKPVNIVEVDKHLEAENIMQMVNAGIWDLTVVDSHVAGIWSSVLKNLVLHEDLIVNQGSNIAWAVRHGSPRLLESLNGFVAKNRQGTLLGNILIKRYYRSTHWLDNPVRASDRVKLQKLAGIFKKYAQKYNFDWLKLAALGYQESLLDQTAKSPRGAVGIMQILPSTAAGKPVLIPDISTPENNIHAGTKYLAYLRDTYFSKPDISAFDRVNFTFAGYNAGPSKINRLRKKASAQGLDPNQWFHHVEVVARQEIGRETVQYVANIHMYYIAYKTSWQLSEKRDKLIDSKLPGN